MSVQTIDENSHKNSHKSSHKTESTHISINIPKYQYLLILFILVFSVLFRAGNRPLPMMVLEITAILLLLLCFLKPVTLSNSSRGLKVTLWALSLFPLLYLIPIPWDIWRLLPGRELYAETLLLFDTTSMFKATSIYPLKTQSAWFALLPPVAVFVTTLRLSSTQIQTLVFVLIGIAVGEAVLGLIQYGEGPMSAFRFNNPYSTNGAEGTYANRNHLAGLLEMVLPLSLGLLALSVGQTRKELHYHRSWRARIASLAGWHMNKTVVFGCVCILILLGLIFTQSRSGVALAMLGIFISTIAYSRRLGGTNVFGVIGSFFAIVIALAIEIGLAPLMQRFTADHLEDLRFTIFNNTIKGIGTFFPVGSGPGTYPFIYPRFQSVEETAFINHAHSDYLEWLMEGGLIAGVFILLYLWFYIRQWPRVWVKGDWSRFQFMQVGAGIGLLLMILHGLTDFNLHIPANAIYFAFLAGVFFYSNSSQNYSHGNIKQTISATNDSNRNVGNTMTGSSQSFDLRNSPNDVQTKKIANPQDIPNPFADKDEKKI